MATIAGVFGFCYYLLSLLSSLFCDTIKQEILKRITDVTVPYLP